MLREQPDALLPCRDASDAASRVWAAHALRLLGRGAEASTLYRSAQEPLPELASVLKLAAVRAEFEGGRPPAEVLAGYTPDDLPKRWLRAESLALVAELQLASERPEEARATAREAAKQGAASDAMALVELKAALALHEDDAASRSLVQLRTEYPDSGPAAEAERLAGAQRPIGKLEPADLARRWARWSGHGGAAAVAAECEPLLGKLRGKPADAAKARLECGKALSTMRNPEAEHVLRLAARERTVRAAALLATARVLARGDTPAPVTTVCAELAATKSRDEMAECDFLAAVLRLNHGAREQGRAALESVAARFPRHPRGSDALWFLALDDLKDGPGQAFARFDTLVRAAKDAQEKAQALYWRGRTRPPDQTDEARADWREAALIDPYGYYGWLGAARARGDGAPAGPATGGAEASGPKESTGVGGMPAAARLASVLLSTGFLRYAALELAESVSPGRADALSWVPFLAQAGQFDTVLRIGQAQGGPGQPWPPPPEKRAAVEAAFPLAFPEALAHLPEAVDPYFILSLMRRESRYDPDATSAAQARGLLQLLPKTAAMLAKELGEPVPPDEHLHDPTLNVHLAAQYVGRLQKRFGHPFVVAAAYNAGPRSAAKWASESSQMEIDEWVERIPFRETRAYVKAVAAAYGAYGLLYTGARPTLRFGPVGAPGEGVDF